MKLKTQRLLLNLSSVGLLLVACGGLAALLFLPIDVTDAKQLATNAVRTSAHEIKTQTTGGTIDAQHPVWSRSWRQPLYDPPPPPPVAVASRPITVKLMGTIIEPENSQAFVEMASGSVELKRVGDQLTSDPEDGTIADIAATEITITRADGEHQLKVAE